MHSWRKFFFSLKEGVLPRKINLDWIVLVFFAMFPADALGTGFEKDQSPEEIVANSSFEDLITSHLVFSSERDAETVSQALKEKLFLRARADNGRYTEHVSGRLNWQGKTMRFSMDKKGQPGEAGYPVYIALHGGGQTSPAVNDSQWNHMKIYYKSSVDHGIYIAPRGVTDTWNLHFVPESYPLYDRMIENLIAYENADPERIYLLGFSAGGDGVYQIIPRMPDRWAAANMSAGHHNFISFQNLAQVPFLLQMGEHDSAYQRNRVAAENFRALQHLQQGNPGLYQHDLFLHFNGSHNSWYDNQPEGVPQIILADPVGWLDSGDRSVIRVNSNAVHWLRNYQRNSRPNTLVWDMATFAGRPQGQGANYVASESIRARLASSEDLFYWLDRSPETGGRNGFLKVQLDSKENRIVFQDLENINGLRLLLTPEMLDFSRQVRVKIGDEIIGDINLTSRLNVMTRTLLERSDPRFLFHDEITLLKSESGWTLKEVTSIGAF